MSCIKLELDYEIVGSELVIDALNISEGIASVQYPETTIVDIAAKKTTIQATGKCPETGLPISSTYNLTWDSDVAQTGISISGSESCCADEYACYNGMVGIASVKKSDCKCIEYPADAHISYSGLYLDKILSFKPFIYKSNCSDVWQEVNDAKIQAINLLESRIAECITSCGYSDGFNLHQQDVGLLDCVDYLRLKGSDYIGIRVSPQRNLVGGSLNIKTLKILPFFVEDHRRGMVNETVKTDLYIYRNGIMISHKEILINKTYGLSIPLEELDLGVGMNKAKHYDFYIGLKGHVVDGDYISPQIKLYPAANKQHGKCCGAPKPEWTKSINIHVKHGDILGNFAKYSGVGCDKRMGGVCFVIEGGCCVRDFICARIGNKKSLLFKQFAEALHVLWAACFLDIQRAKGASQNLCLNILLADIEPLMSRYLKRASDLLGFTNQDGKYVAGSICNAISQSGLRGSCYKCGEASKRRFGKAIV